MKKVLAVFLFLTMLSAYAQPARIIIFRHAEKPTDPENHHLSPAGVDRANKLTPWLTQVIQANTNAPLATLFASKPTKKGHSIRCQETLEPFAKAAGKRIETPFPAEEYAAFAKQIITDKSLQGKTIVICWTHDYIPDLTHTLGINPKPPEWKKWDYASAYILTFDGATAKWQYVQQDLSKSAP